MRCTKCGMTVPSGVRCGCSHQAPLGWFLTISLGVVCFILTLLAIISLFAAESSLHFVIVAIALSMGAIKVGGLCVRRGRVTGAQWLVLLQFVLFAVFFTSLTYGYGHGADLNTPFLQLLAGLQVRSGEHVNNVVFWLYMAAAFTIACVLTTWAGRPPRRP